MWLGILAGIFLFVCFSGIFMVCNDHRINDMSAKELVALLEKWYGKTFDDFVLLTLEKQ